jgi:phytoene dehydrogenase-like protein
MPDRFDIIVAGAGHNSRIAAAYLAKAGFRRLVLEGRPVAGGDCVTEVLTWVPPRHLRLRAGRAAGLTNFAPNLTDDKILVRLIESPLDLERINPHEWHGTCHGGAKSPAQSRDSVRPARPRAREGRRVRMECHVGHAQRPGKWHRDCGSEKSNNACCGEMI